jgi:hydroxymethylpyrimidine/phosphomethylpyrimidine kinase
MVLFKQREQAMQGRVLAIAGSDSSGGAGIQADIKTVSAFGGYAMTAIAALTAQNSQGVRSVYPVPPSFVAEQIAACLDDIGVDAIKIGMLGSSAVIEAVAQALNRPAVLATPLILDPVMTAKGGARLLDEGAASALMCLLVPKATLLTPNVPEAEVLTGLAIANADDMRLAGHRLLAMGAQAVLMKGGHLPGARVADWLITADEERAFVHERVTTRHDHGTGCTLASAIAVLMAQGESLASAIEKAHLYVAEALRTAPGYGSGHGPLNHLHAMRRHERHS